MYPETVDREKGEIKLGNGMAFTTKKIGFSPEVLKRLFAVRDEKKTITQNNNIGTNQYKKAWCRKHNIQSIDKRKSKENK